MSTTVTVNYVVRNGGTYIRFFLNSLKNQTYKNFKVNVWDNNSDDGTIETVKAEYPEFQLRESKENIGVWAAVEKLIGRQTDSKYIICMTDVILKEDFIEKAVEIMDKNPDCGALQAKIYQMDIYNGGEETNNRKPKLTNVIDTLGFKIFRSRKIVSLGQGETDTGQYNELKEVFATEGAVPVFRREALESCKINGWLIDPDYRVGPLGYGDDLDLAWRMRIFGWKHILAHDVIAYHDRSTTKGYSKNLKDYFKRRRERSKINIVKRRLDWRNLRWTLVKNDYTINILKDLPWIVSREIAVLGYAVLFEPGVLKEMPTFFKHLPEMLRKRKEIMKKAVVNPKEMRKWIN